MNFKSAKIEDIRTKKNKSSKSKKIKPKTLDSEVESSVINEDLEKSPTPASDYVLPLLKEDENYSSYNSTKQNVELDLGRLVWILIQKHCFSFFQGSQKK